MGTGSGTCVCVWEGVESVGGGGYKTDFHFSPDLASPEPIFDMLRVLEHARVKKLVSECLKVCIPNTFLWREKLSNAFFSKF